MRSFKKAAVVTVAATSLIVAGSSAAFAGSEAEGAAVGSPGVLSGNLIQIPVSIPTNECGNTTHTASGLNRDFGTICINAN